MPVRALLFCVLAWIIGLWACGEDKQVDCALHPSDPSCKSSGSSGDAATSTLSLNRVVPASSILRTIPETLTVSFNEPIALPELEEFVFSGTCTTLPQATNPTLSSTATAVTINLVGGECSDGQVLSLTINPAAFSDANGKVGTGDPSTFTYTFSTQGPSISLSPPDKQLLSAADTVIIEAIFTESSKGATSLSGSLTETGEGVGLSVLTGNPTCSIAVSDIKSSGATIKLSSCQGSGTFTIHINAGVLQDSVGNLSAASSESSVITLDNLGPTLVSVIPNSNLVSTLPEKVIASFSEAVQALSSSAFTLAGTCTRLPTLAVAMSQDAKTATVSLTDGSCSEGQKLTLSLEPSKAMDLIGNAGTGEVVAKTYTLSSLGPTATLSAPSRSSLNSSSSTVLSLSYTDSSAGETTLSGTLTSSGGGVSVTTVSGSPSCTIAVSDISKSGATVTLSSCTGNGSLSVHVDAGTAKDALGNNSSASNESSVITVDNTSPSLTSSSPANNATFTSIPSTIVLTFSEAVIAEADDFSLTTGTCTTNPSIGSISGSGTTAITVNLSGGTCGSGQNIVLQTTLTSISDSSGNVGVGSSTITLSKPVKKMFKTAATRNANLGGPSGADAYCAVDSNKPNDGLTYKAALADGSTRRACSSANCASSGVSENIDWVMAPNTTYYRTDGTTAIATTNSYGIFSYPTTNALDTAYDLYWTGIKNDWTTDTTQYCSGWTSTSGNGALGIANVTTSSFMFGAAMACTNTKKILCVAQ